MPVLANIYGQDYVCVIAPFAGNTHQTLPHGIGSRQVTVADTCPDTGNGSRLFEISPWMWRCGRGQPRKASVAEAERRRQEQRSQANHQAAQTLKRRREERMDEFYKRQHGRVLQASANSKQYMTCYLALKSRYVMLYIISNNNIIYHALSFIIQHSIYQHI